MLKVAGLGVENVEQWIDGKDMCGFEIFKSFAKTNCRVNDFAEHNILLIKDFVNAYNAKRHETKCDVSGKVEQEKGFQRDAKSLNEKSCLN